MQKTNNNKSGHWYGLTLQLTNNLLVALVAFVFLFGLAIVVYLTFPEKNRDFASGLFTSLALTVIVPPILALWTRYTEEPFRRAEMAEEVRRMVGEANHDMGRVYKSGIITAHEPLKFGEEFLKDVGELTNAGEGEILLLNTFIPNFTAVSYSLIPAIKMGVKVRLLIVDPRCAVARQRSLDLHGDKPDYVPNSIHSLLAEIEKVRNNLGAEHAANLEVRLTWRHPSITLYGCLNEKGGRGPWARFHVGVLWSRQQAVEGPFLVVGAEGSYSDALRKHFESLWDGSLKFEKFSDFNPPRIEKALRYEHLFYASIEHGDKRIWRYIHMVPSFEDRGTHVYEDKEQRRYMWYREVQESIVQIHMHGIGSSADHGVAVFSCESDPTSSNEYLVGVHVHQTWNYSTDPRARVAGPTHALSAAVFFKSVPKELANLLGPPPQTATSDKESSLRSGTRIENTRAAALLARYWSKSQVTEVSLKGLFKDLVES